MRMTTVLNKLLRMQGLWVRGLKIRWEQQELWVVVEPRWRVHRCGCCGRRARRRHDRAWRSWRHLDVFGWRCLLRYQVWRVRCPRCGVRTEKVPWAAAGSRFTRDFEQQVAWLAKRCDLTAVTEYFRVSWSSVRRIVDRVVERAWDADSALDGLRVIGVDEISYRRHHHYLTVVVDHASGRV
jgi:transposase